MTKVVLAACLLLACSITAAPLAVAKDPTQLLIHKGARVGVINLLDPEVTHFHGSKTLEKSFLKTQPVNWQVDSMLADALSARITKLELVPVQLAAGSQSLLRNRDQYFVNNSVAKGLPKEISRELASIATAEHVDAIILLAPGLNNSAQAGNAVRRNLPDYLRGWGFVTDDTGTKPALFNMTQVLLVSFTPDGVVMNAREWGGAYTDDWADYSLADTPKVTPPEQLDHLQPLFARLLARQADRVLDFITVTP
jgi:hypothetical protein